MVKTKKRRSSAQHSSTLHNAKRRYSADCSIPVIKKTILTIILIATLAIIASLLCAFFLNPERVVKSKISALATNYYENYFYEKLANSNKFQNLTDRNASMAKYHESGLSPITLHDLLTYGDQSSADYLTKYCDDTETSIKFYMDPPYERQNYHYDVTYSCNF